MAIKQHRMWLAIVVLLGVAIRFVALFASAPTDDAYITFRYADNIAAGQGFVYNDNERVLGTTTPIFTLLLVPFAAAGVPLDFAATLLAILFDAMIIVLLYRVVRLSDGDAAGLLAAFFYAMSYVAISACANAMETQLFMVFVVGCVLATVSGGILAAAVLCGLAILTRPEGFLLAGICAIAFAVRRRGKERRAFARAALAFAAVTVPWFVFATFYFGSPVPNSALAKWIQQGVTAQQWLDFFVTRNPVVALLWAGAAVATVGAIRRRATGLWLLASWALVYSLFFLATRPPFLGGWYFPPAVMPITALSAVAAVSVFRLLGVKSMARAAIVAAGLYAAMTAVVLPRSFRTTRWHRQVVDKVYRPLAQWVGAETAPEATIHASDIGYLGYESRRTIVDAAALVTPDVWRYYSAHGSDPDWDVSFLMEKLPDYVVLPVKGSIYARFLNGGLLRRYDAVARFQVEGESNLNPPMDITLQYEREGRFMADFIVYARRTE